MQKHSSLLPVIVKSWLVAGTLDILLALSHFYFDTGKDPMLVPKFIASSLVGNKAYTGGNEMVLLGFVLHYVVALLFTLSFFMIYTPLRLYQWNRILTGIVYGVFIWLVMNKMVLPLTQVRLAPHDTVKMLTGMLILVVAIGLPLSFFAFHAYKKNSFNRHGK